MYLSCNFRSPAVLEITVLWGVFSVKTSSLFEKGGHCVIAHGFSGIKGRWLFKILKAKINICASVRGWETAVAVRCNLICT